MEGKINFIGFNVYLKTNVKYLKDKRTVYIEILYKYNKNTVLKKKIIQHEISYMVVLHTMNKIYWYSTL